ncbi:MAG: hypothetical protein IT448_00760 [Phycisphaerales bacterium]|nr:hypothetical protein [Phycisphaerales bacterium]
MSHRLLRVVVSLVMALSTSLACCCALKAAPMPVDSSIAVTVATPVASVPAQTGHECCSTTDDSVPVKMGLAHSMSESAMTAGGHHHAPADPSAASSDSHHCNCPTHDRANQMQMADHSAGKLTTAPHFMLKLLWPAVAEPFIDSSTPAGVTSAVISAPTYLSPQSLVALYCLLTV